VNNLSILTCGISSDVRRVAFDSIHTIGYIAGLKRHDYAADPTPHAGIINLDPVSDVVRLSPN
jgi:hypothetical protein